MNVTDYLTTHYREENGSLTTVADFYKGFLSQVPSKRARSLYPRWHVVELLQAAGVQVIKTPDGLWYIVGWNANHPRVAERTVANATVESGSVEIVNV